MIVKFPDVLMATGEGKPLTFRELAAAGLTVMPDWVPVMELVAVSVAVSDWLPAVFKVALNDPVPLVSVALAGSTAWPSLLLKWAVPL